MWTAKHLDYLDVALSDPTDLELRTWLTKAIKPDKAMHKALMDANTLEIMTATRNGVEVVELTFDQFLMVVTTIAQELDHTDPVSRRRSANNAQTSNQNKFTEKAWETFRKKWTVPREKWNTWSAEEREKYIAHRRHAWDSAKANKHQTEPPGPKSHNKLIRSIHSLATARMVQEKQSSSAPAPSPAPTSDASVTSPVTLLHREQHLLRLLPVAMLPDSS